MDVIEKNIYIQVFDIRRVRSFFFNVGRGWGDGTSLKKLLSSAVGKKLKMVDDLPGQFSYAVIFKNKNGLILFYTLNEHISFQNPFHKTQRQFQLQADPSNIKNNKIKLF